MENRIAPSNSALYVFVKRTGSPSTTSTDMHLAGTHGEPSRFCRSRCDRRSRWKRCRRAVSGVSKPQAVAAMFCEHPLRVLPCHHPRHVHGTRSNGSKAVPIVGEHTDRGRDAAALRLQRSACVGGVLSVNRRKRASLRSAITLLFDETVLVHDSS